MKVLLEGGGSAIRRHSAISLYGPGGRNFSRPGAHAWYDPVMDRPNDAPDCAGTGAADCADTGAEALAAAAPVGAGTSGVTRPARDPEPMPPVEPGLSDCCGSGCSPCIIDLYQDALDRYLIDLAQWQARQPHRRTGP
jgi:hypothetical protein